MLIQRAPTVNADGSVGGTAQEVGGPFSADGSVGKQCTYSVPPPIYPKLGSFTRAVMPADVVCACVAVTKQGAVGGLGQAVAEKGEKEASKSEQKQKHNP